MHLLIHQIQLKIAISNTQLIETKDPPTVLRI
jgi:hypothetical protein